ncbi:hypothetical protein KCP71_22910 [Salmonella enterica subsp. enterica]|nr:hypothetical protein KCP71_22910 [Salmonella enterica subsp. enterica]
MPIFPIHVSYANANKEATALVSQQVRDNPGIYPPADAGQVVYPGKCRSRRLIASGTRAWTKVKSG